MTRDGRPGARLCLFDIDGTLLGRRPGPDAHGAAIVDAVAYVVGASVEAAEVRAVARPGMTDWEILALGVERVCGRTPTPGEIRDGLRHGADRYAERIVDAPMLPVLAGAREAGSALRGAGVEVALVTGNVERIAAAKLNWSGLGDYYVPGAGGFGDESPAREDLVRLALERAGRSVADARDAVVVGDTPRDIACARAHGVRVIAVPTGPYDRDALAAADAVAEDLFEVVRMLLDDLA